MANEETIVADIVPTDKTNTKSIGQVTDVTDITAPFIDLTPSPIITTPSGQKCQCDSDCKMVLDTIQIEQSALKLRLDTMDFTNQTTTDTAVKDAISSYQKQLVNMQKMVSEQKGKAITTKSGNYQ